MDNQIGAGINPAEKMTETFKNFTQNMKAAQGNFPFWKWAVAFICSCAVGVALAAVLAGMIYGERKDKDENAKYLPIFKKILVPGIFTGAAIGLIVVATFIYPRKFPVELLVLSCIIIGGFISTISANTPVNIFVGIGIAFVYLSSKSLVLFIMDKVNEMKMRKQEVELESLQKMQPI